MDTSLLVAFCYCSRCSPSRQILIRTCRKHLEIDEKQIEMLLKAGEGAGSESIQFIQQCIVKTRDSISETIESAVKEVEQEEMDRARLSISEDRLSDGGEPLDESPDLPYSSESNEDEDTTPTTSATPTTSNNTDNPIIDHTPNPPIPASLHPLYEPPECVMAIRRELLGDYTVGNKPTEPFVVDPLTAEESLSLQHYIAWKNSNGTVRAYNKHRVVLENATGMEILSLYRVRKLALDIARLEPQLVDMCPKSCMAFTGPHSEKSACTYVNPRTKSECGEPRKRMMASGKMKPSAQVTILPIVPSIQALLSNGQGLEQLEHRDRCLKEVLKVAEAARKYSDFADGSIHEAQSRQLGLYQDRRDVALALSSDSAQLTLKKQSSTWILIIIILNLPPELRYRARNVVINFAIPGPNVPSDIESFLWPLFRELARASEGIYLWDGIRAEWFLHCTYVAMFLGDMLGSAKVNGMSGHSAVRGCCFMLVEGAQSSLQKGSKHQYYPLSAPENMERTYNPTRPVYGPQNLPMRRQEDYWATLTRLDKATTLKEKARISKETGVSKIPIAASLVGFMHPSFFPLDDFHLFYENCMPWLWDISTIHSKPSDPVHIPETRAKSFGEHISRAMDTLPPAFCGRVRDPFLKRQSQYKAFEWMALLHWYFFPIGLELEFKPNLLLVFSSFAYIVDYAMTLKARSEEDLRALRAKIWTFLGQFEQLYVGNEPEKIQRCRLCIFQLIHIPIHIKWNGSIRMGSQATCERTIGEMGHQIKSKKDPFANLTSIIVEREATRIVQLYHPSLVGTAAPRNRKRPLLLFQRLPPRKTTPVAELHTAAIRTLFQSAFADIERFGKAKLSNGYVLRSRISEETTSSSRMYQWFEFRHARSLNSESSDSEFGEALSFYDVTVKGERHSVVVFRPLIGTHAPLPTVLRGRWPDEGKDDVRAVELKHVENVVGILEFAMTKNVYVLRKHGALDSCSPSELGLVDEMEQDGEEEDET